ncbi:flagellar assembly protein FliH [Arsukibacterium sp. UBA3155]|uniref:flagellar assembly protein FliH n=1 Tax=Arsukibacterium sp. UBA3155 TaxID=1946058 RepID=UPI0025C60C58|nr:flagellar assembly protein FliH [Arsukibacterium sp. UBA3155]|tara:strand:- start:180906 stop:181904 length:999 start_codon:yes stop_codon:yes gene_type:complete
MIKNAHNPNRPYSPDPDQAEQIKHWHTPDLTADARSQDTRTNALNLQRPDSKRVADDETEETLEIKPLTADDIEQMRQAAHDEGMLQGKEEGFAKGYSEGREQGQQDGLKQGLAEGKKQGLADAATEIDTLRAELSVLFDQLQQPLAKIDNRVEQELVQLALAMAKSVINVEVTTNPQVILQALQEAIGALPLQSNAVTIKLNPADVATVKQHYSETEITERGWQLRAEPLLAQGGCLVQSSSSSVDRSIQQRVQSSLEHFLQLEEAAEHAAESIINDTVDDTIDDIAADTEQRKVTESDSPAKSSQSAPSSERQAEKEKKQTSAQDPKPHD